MISLRWKTGIAEGHLVTLQSWEQMNNTERLDALGDWIYYLNELLEKEMKEGVS
tara:strand:- start:287 stop:448 length:162 start_codon:yes stop_codon:yes gene_type:complete